MEAPGYSSGIALGLFISGYQCSGELHHFFLCLERHSFGTNHVVLPVWFFALDVFSIAFLSAWDHCVSLEYVGFRSLQRAADAIEHAGYQFVLPGGAGNLAGNGCHLALASG
jgi:hypothetical protein